MAMQAKLRAGLRRHRESTTQDEAMVIMANIIKRVLRRMINVGQQDLVSEGRKVMRHCVNGQQANLRGVPCNMLHRAEYLAVFGWSGPPQQCLADLHTFRV